MDDGATVKSYVMSKEVWQKEFGKKLHFAIKMSGMSVREFSKRTNVSRETVYRYLNGDMTPTAYTIFVMSQVLNLTPNYFIAVI